MASCFFITPFTAEGAGGEDPQVFEAVQGAVLAAAEATGLDLRRADDIFQAGVVIDQIRGEIERVDLIIAVCTGRNANVFYELGVADAANHHPVLVAATRSDLPFDVQHYRAQMYGSPNSLDDLSDRLVRAIEETLETTPPRHAVVGEPQRPVSSEVPLELVRSDDAIGFMEGAKDVIQQAGDVHNQIGQDNWNTRPSDMSLAELSFVRYSSVDSILEWLRPAAEYRPEWLARPADLLSTWFHKRPSTTPVGYDFWAHLHETWVALTLRSLFCLGLIYESPEAIEATMALRPSPGGDSAPLLINRDFTWALGYHGNSDIGFNDFITFAEESEVFGSILDEIPVDASLDLACGADLGLGMARVVFDATNGADPLAEPRASRIPYIYAGFASYYCNRIQWAARTLDTNEGISVGIGAEDLASFQETAAAWYPALIERTEKMTRTCDSWSMAANA
jgi:hypothetical protein